jgi:glutathione S-transferase
LTLWRICRAADIMCNGQQHQSYPVLWSFRRCPYAMRARLAINASQSRVHLREIRLRDKPKEFVSASPKATVPVLVLPDGHVIDESRDIMIWALQQSDPRGWLRLWHADPAFCNAFLDRLDGPFKQQLDRYKYASRFEPAIGQQSRQDACVFLAEINQFLESKASYLSGADFGVLDAATLPFVRQFRGVDEIWFDSQPWPHLHRWLGMFLNSADFGAVMQKYQPWQAGDRVILFPA